MRRRENLSIAWNNKIKKDYAFEMNGIQILRQRIKKKTFKILVYLKTNPCT